MLRIRFEEDLAVSVTHVTNGSAAFLIFRTQFGDHVDSVSDEGAVSAAGEHQTHFALAGHWSLTQSNLLNTTTAATKRCQACEINTPLTRLLST